MLRPGEVVTASTMYLAPDTVLGQELIWQFAASPAGPAARISLPPQDKLPAAEVRAREVKLESNLLVVTLGISSTLHPIELAAADLMIEGGSLPPAVNSFPWRVAAGGGAEFTLVLSPQANPLRLGLLGQGFEIAY